MRIKQIDVVDEITKIAVKQTEDFSCHCVSRMFLDVFENWNKAAVFSKIAYYFVIERPKSDRYFHKMYEEFAKELRMTERSLKNYMKEFRDLGIIEMKYRKVDGLRVSHYTIDIPAFTKYCDEKLKGVE